MIEDGILLIDKPAGITSFGVVARVRRVLNQEYRKRSDKNGKSKIKVGHTGTLDPFATGLMILVIGSECKNSNKYLKMNKVYEANFRLGFTSTTGDPEGEITKINNNKPSTSDVKKVLSEFVGEIKQRPPVFSAIKVNGQRAYKLARNGKEIELPLRLSKY